MKYRNTIAVAISSFIFGCMVTLNTVNIEKCNPANTQSSESKRSLEMKAGDRYDNVNFVVIIFSRPLNVENRETVRNTWAKLIERVDTNLQNAFKYFFVVGLSSLTDDLRFKLRRENENNNDLMILPEVEDHYSTLSKKLLQSMRWLKENVKNLLYVIKCDDDSFVRVDMIVRELHDRTNKILIDSRSSVKYSSLTGKLKKIENIADTGLYWGYFKGNAHIQRQGSWAETEWFLCDRYLPYALGGGYVISADVVDFITANHQYLKLYYSEDVSLGVWTAPLSRLHRRHDVRFDTEWTSRGCNNSHIIRHKQSPESLTDMYETLVQSQYKTLCRREYENRKSYEYNWKIPPSRCCEALPSEISRLKQLVVMQN